MSHIFVSYASANRPSVEVFVTLLKRFHNVWYDQTGIKAGTPDWFDAINAGIEAASAMIVMVTPESMASEYVEYEYVQAQKRAIPVFTYILSDPSDPMPEALKPIQWLRADAAQGFEKLLDALPNASRIWGPALIDQTTVFSGKTFAEIAHEHPDDILRPIMTRPQMAYDLVGLPIEWTRYHKLYLIGRANHVPSPKPQSPKTVQVAVQLTARNFSLERQPGGNYLQDDFPASIAQQLLQSPRDNVRLLLVRGPLSNPHDSDPPRMGLDSTRPSEWVDAVEAIKRAQNYYQGEPKIQLFMQGPAMLLYKLGVTNAGFRPYELYQLNFATKTYDRILQG